nr:TonB family protein [uncultured Novosphingobium sp.]
MSYVDRHSTKSLANGSQKALTGGIVALIQGGLVLALVNGFAVTMLRSDPPKNPEATQIRLEPIPVPPPPEPQAQPDRPVDQPLLTAPTPRIQLPAQDPVQVSTTVPTATPSSFEPTERVAVALPTPTETPARFQPRGALPSNAASGWVTTQDYPTADLRAEHQGSVRFRLDIDARGRVSQCAIVASSGFTGLDEATCKYVSRRARFEPATNAEGQAASGSYLGTIRWIIPRD